MHKRSLALQHKCKQVSQHSSHHNTAVVRPPRHIRLQSLTSMHRTAASRLGTLACLCAWRILQAELETGQCLQSHR